jgi:hypothetical protein
MEEAEYTSLNWSVGSDGGCQEGGWLRLDYMKMEGGERKESQAIPVLLMVI